ncbi:MAG: hypothetical protein JWL62_2492, partial [Hyphomicrobiales bacterium]|nr:hypothetical protein [Hyphomicrobiales bacterium]
VDYVLIEDTGSTDGTQAIIRNWLDMCGIPGEVVEEPWRDFASNRSDALRRLRAHTNIDYAFVIDADDLLSIDADCNIGDLKHSLSADFYDVEIVHGGIKHHRPHLFRNRLDFSYRGVLHEFVETPPGPLTRVNLPSMRIHASTSGARSHNARKYHDDAALLEKALANEVDPFLISRYCFYLAQSYRDCGELPKALENYLMRAELGFWNEEVYVSLLRAGQILTSMGRPFDEVIEMFRRAEIVVPLRAEALHAAAHYCRTKGENGRGAQFARRAAQLTMPDGGLFLEPWVYDYGALDELAVNAYWAGSYRECLDASLKLLAERPIPNEMRSRVLANAMAATEHLPKDPQRGRLGADGFLEQHSLGAARPLFAPPPMFPRILVAILAKQKEPCLALYLKCIEELDYPKSSIVLSVRTNNNTDRTEFILKEWLDRVGPQYAAVEFDASDVATRVERYGPHEWNAARFSVLGEIRKQSLQRTLELQCDFYFVVDLDNFIRPCTLKELVALQLPIVAPFLRAMPKGAFYSNYHAEVDDKGYYAPCDQYLWILERHVRGLIEVPVVHCTYLVRADVISKLSYLDMSGRYEYVIFADSARKQQIPQYLDNRQVYGYITFQDGPLHFDGDIALAERQIEDAKDRSFEFASAFEENEAVASEP